MEIQQWEAGLDYHQQENGGTMVFVTRAEAIRIIRSLSGQLEEYDPNYGRLDHFAPDGRFFSIGVLDGNALFRGKKISLENIEKKYDACGDCGEWAKNCTCDDDDVRCDNCGTHDRADGEIWCQKCIDNCECEFCCDYDDEEDDEDDTSLEDHEVVIPPLNAFDRARCLKIQRESDK